MMTFMVFLMAALLLIPPTQIQFLLLCSFIIFLKYIIIDVDANNQLIVLNQLNSQLGWDLNPGTQNCESRVLPEYQGSSPIQDGNLISNSCRHCMNTICCSEPRFVMFLKQKRCIECKGWVLQVNFSKLNYQSKFANKKLLNGSSH